MSARGEEAYVAEAPQVIMFSSPGHTHPPPTRLCYRAGSRLVVWGLASSPLCLRGRCALALSAHTGLGQYTPHKEAKGASTT